MKTWKLRLCKIAPGVTLAALFGYTCAIVTDQALASAQLNSVILAWLVLANLAALGSLGWALHRCDIQQARDQLVEQLDQTHREVTEIRILVVNLAPPKSNPRLRFTQPQPEPPREDPVWRQNTAANGQIRGSVYGSAPAAVEQGSRPELSGWDQFVSDYNTPREDTGDVTPEGGVRQQ